MPTVKAESKASKPKAIERSVQLPRGLPILLAPSHIEKPKKTFRPVIIARIAKEMRNAENAWRMRELSTKTEETSSNKAEPRRMKPKVPASKL